MDDETLGRLLAEARTARELAAVPLGGGGVRRGPFKAAIRVAGLPARWTVDVWDDQYGTVLIVEDPEFDGERLRALFQWRKRMASLQHAHRAVGGVVHHLDGDPMNNDPGNLVIVDPADNTSRQPR